MFQSALRKNVVAPLARGFSTATNGGKNNTPLIIAGALAVAAGSYFIYNSEAGVYAESKDESDAKPRPVAFTKSEFTNLTLSKVETYNHNTNQYTFKFDDPNAICGGPITHLLMVKAAENGLIVDEKGNDVARPYTPISRPDLAGEVVLLVKKYDTGKISPHLASLKPGDKAGFKGTFPKFKYVPGALDHGICVAGGSGITPHYQLIDHALSLKDDKTKWTLFYSNVTEDDILLRKEWDALAKAHPDRLKVVYVLDKPPAGWTGPTGYISQQLLKDNSPAGSEAGEAVKVFVCGPPGQVAAIAGPKDGMKQGPVGGVLKELGFSEGQVFKF
ncbi:NADH-cytochrome b-5 reductase [Phaffia rhodozyma]|uniref:cytochrome-b5 reductase n=1 Tax=Phaffia rhodozyma TaxID=264483 RepID=A0A0F7SQV7_PHARH|nr:NADH-cytochrome b-5 reductase [Phaffia rhodozyma]